MSQSQIFHIMVNGKRVAICTSLSMAKREAAKYVHHYNRVIIVNRDTSAELTGYSSRSRRRDIEWFCTRSGIAA